jgi:hypothetical protein
MKTLTITSTAMFAVWRLPRLRANPLELTDARVPPAGYGLLLLESQLWRPQPSSQSG